MSAKHGFGGRGRQLAGMTPHEAASYWFVRQDTQAMTAEDHDEFDRWLASSEVNRRAYERTVVMWHGVADAIDDGESRALRVAALAVVPQARVWPRAVAVAGSALVAMVVLVALTWQLSTGTSHSPSANTLFASDSRYITGKKQQSTTTLPDGTHVVMNLDTDFSVDFTPGRREVRLLKGQAFFDVAKDAQRPFVVAAADRRVQALGTKFDVRVADQRLEVVLLEGRVRIERDEPSLLDRLTLRSDRVELRPDERLIATVGGSASIAVTKAAQATSWHEGWVTFEDESLERAIAELNRYSDRPIVITDDRVRAMRLSGVFRIGQPDRFAEIIQELLPLAVEHDGQDNVLLVRRPDGASHR